MNQRGVFNRFLPFSLALLLLTPSNGFAQEQSLQTSGQSDSSLSESVRELREQVQELRQAVDEMKSETATYRKQNEELRSELEEIRGRSAPLANPASTGESAQTAEPLDQRVSSLQETTQVLQSEVRTQYQSKVESASKYRVRLSGLVLLNLFSNRGAVDNLDFPTYAAPTNVYNANSAFGATLRQSELGLEVFGPQVAGAKTSGQIQFDFGGGSPPSLDGINSGLVRLRTADMRLDWGHTSIIAGQDSLFISPLSPTSFASLVIPSLGYSGNLWAWTPQLRVEHRFDVAENENITVQGGILDNLTGEPSRGTHRQPQAGESSGLPAYAVRTSWNRNPQTRPMSFGISGYYSRQNWGFGWIVDGWTAAADWRVPFGSLFELSGEFYRGRGAGGIGAGIGQSIIFSGNSVNPPTFRALDAAGGWSQIKFSPTRRLEFNGAFGADNPFASDIHAFPAPVDYYPTVLAANRSALFNLIYRPRGDLLFSGEYRHLHTTGLTNYNSAGQVNVMMGVLF